jgi:hypothetical protein
MVGVISQEKARSVGREGQKMAGKKGLGLKRNIVEKGRITRFYMKGAEKGLRKKDRAKVSKTSE